MLKRIGVSVVALAVIICVGVIHTSLFAPANGTAQAEQTRQEGIYDSPTSANAESIPIDISKVDQGYFGVSCVSEYRLKVMFEKGEESSIHDMPSDGSVATYGLTFGNGPYKITIWEHEGGDLYHALYEEIVEVVMEDEHLPYLRPTYLCQYDQSSAYVEKARELATGKSDREVTDKVEQWMRSEMTYDEELAQDKDRLKGYTSEPVVAYENKKGLCIDNAVIAAAMLRSQGIPTKVVCGYIYPTNASHAWNEVYIDGQWTIIDPTGYQGKGTTYEKTLEY